MSKQMSEFHTQALMRIFHVSIKPQDDAFTVRARVNFPVNGDAHIYNSTAELTYGGFTSPYKQIVAYAKEFITKEIKEGKCSVPSAIHIKEISLPANEIPTISYALEFTTLTSDPQTITPNPKRLTADEAVPFIEKLMPLLKERFGKDGAFVH